MDTKLPFSYVFLQMQKPFVSTTWNTAVGVYFTTPTDSPNLCLELLMFDVSNCSVGIARCRRPIGSSGLCALLLLLEGVPLEGGGDLHPKIRKKSKT